MKRIILVAGMASVAAGAALLWSVPASASTTCGSSACAVVHDRWPGRPVSNQNIRTNQPSPSGVPEPGVLPLLLAAVVAAAWARARSARRTR